MIILKKTFTLLELVIATAILAVGLVTILELAANSSAKVFNVEKKWQQQHALTQAVEFYLIEGHENNPDDRFINTDRFGVNCDIAEVEGLPEDFDLKENLPWQLQHFFIEVNDKLANETVKADIEQLVPKEKVKK